MVVNNSSRPRQTPPETTAPGEAHVPRAREQEGHSSSAPVTNMGTASSPKAKTAPTLAGGLPPTAAPVHRSSADPRKLLAQAEEHLQRLKSKQPATEPPSAEFKEAQRRVAVLEKAIGEPDLLSQQALLVEAEPGGEARAETLRDAAALKRIASEDSLLEILRAADEATTAAERRAILARTVAVYGNAAKQADEERVHALEDLGNAPVSQVQGELATEHAADAAGESEAPYATAAKPEDPPAPNPEDAQILVQMFKDLATRVAEQPDLVEKALLLQAEVEPDRTGMLSDALDAHGRGELSDADLESHVQASLDGLEYVAGLVKAGAAISEAELEDPHYLAPWEKGNEGD